MAPVVSVRIRPVVIALFAILAITFASEALTIPVTPDRGIGSGDDGLGEGPAGEGQEDDDETDSNSSPTTGGETRMVGPWSF